MVTPDEPNSLNLAELVAIAEARGQLEPGEVRLVGWCLDEVPGLDIRPSGAHRRHATLVVAHLVRKADTIPQPDMWKMTDVMPQVDLMPDEDDPFAVPVRPLKPPQSK